MKTAYINAHIRTYLLGRPTALFRVNAGAPNENIVQNHLNIALSNVV